MAPPSAGEGFAPSPECSSELGTSWMSSCGWEAERQWETQTLNPILTSEALDPKWKAGKIKKPPLIPTTTPPAPC